MRRLTNLSINHKLILSYLSFTFAMGFAITGIAVYPPGVIHGSVLILIAQLLVLCATLLGLNIKLDLERKYFSSHNDRDDVRKDIEQIEEAVDKQYGKLE